MTFRSRLSGDSADYEAAARRIAELAARQPGFLGMESERGEDGLGVTVCYWASRDAIDAWREHPEHLAAQEQGRSRWYADWEIDIDFIAGRP
ncbi:antibiotic biosynthesis monooxygenase [Halomonas denitrificans]